MRDRWYSGRLPIIPYFKELWSVIKDALSEFVWSDLRSGFIDLGDLSRPLRFIVVLGFALTTVCLFLLTQTTTLRLLFPFHTSVTPAPGRGLHIPLLLFPLSLFLLTLAWAYILTGARTSHWLMRWGIFFFYTLNAANWLVILLTSDPGAVAFGSVLYTMILLTYLWPNTERLNPTLLFALSLICVGGIFATAQWALITQDQASGLPIGKTILEGHLRSLVTLAIPLLTLVGLDIADFTLHTATWVSEATRKLLPNRIMHLLTFALLAWLVWQGVDDLRLHQPPLSIIAILAQLTGAFGLIALLWFTWGVGRSLLSASSAVTLEDFTSAAGSTAVLFVIIYLLPALLQFLFTEIAQVVQSLAVELQSGFYGDYSAFVQWASTLYTNAYAFSDMAWHYLLLWQRLCACCAVGAALFLYRRNQQASALYAITVGINYLWIEVTRPGQWLQSLNWSSIEPVVFGWTLLLVAWSLHLTWRGQLTSRIYHRLLLTLLLALLRQTNLIAAPLDPLFSLAGVGALAVGLGWDLITAGNWANSSSKRFPRTSRIFLYLGYILLTVMLINWAVAAHDLPILDRFTGEAALTGLSLLGYPYLFALFYLLQTNNLALVEEENSESLPKAN